MTQLVAQVRRPPRDRPILALVIAVSVVELVGASGSIFTVRGLDGWYDTFQQPMRAPPSWVFGPVWTTLFALVGVAVWLVWRRAELSPPRRSARVRRIRGTLRLQPGAVGRLLRYAGDRTGAGRDRTPLGAHRRDHMGLRPRRPTGGAPTCPVSLVGLPRRLSRLPVPGVELSPDPSPRSRAATRP